MYLLHCKSMCSKYLQCIKIDSELWCVCVCWWYFQINHSWLAEQSVLTYINAPLRAADLSARGRFTSLKPTSPASYPLSPPSPRPGDGWTMSPLSWCKWTLTPKLMDNPPEKPNNTLPTRCMHTHTHTGYLADLCKGELEVENVWSLWCFQHSCWGRSDASLTSRRTCRAATWTFISFSSFSHICDCLGYDSWVQQ